MPSRALSTKATSTLKRVECFGPHTMCCIPHSLTLHRLDYAATFSRKKVNRRHARKIKLLRNGPEYDFYGNDTSATSVKNRTCEFDSASRTITNFYFKVATFHLAVKRYRYVMRKELKRMKKLNKQLRLKDVDVEADHPEFYELMGQLAALRSTIKEKVMGSIRFQISKYLNKSNNHPRAKDVYKSLEAKGVDGSSEECVMSWITSESRVLRDTWNAHVDYMNTHRKIMMKYMNDGDNVMTIMHRMLQKYSALGADEAADARTLIESNWIYKSFATGTISLMSGS